MAGGPIGPSSTQFGSERMFPNFNVGAGSGKLFEGYGVEASLGADVSLHLQYDLPPTDPGGTLKLIIKSVTDVAATQSAFLRVLWLAIAAGQNYDAATLLSEHGGGDLEIEHLTTDDDEPLITKVTLDADTIVYGTDHMIQMEIQHESATWDLAVVWTYRPYLIWE